MLVCTNGGSGAAGCTAGALTRRVTQSPLGNARALKSCSSVMQQSVSIRRPLLVSGGYVLVNIILDTSLAYGLTTRPRANTIIDTVTYLVDGTYTAVDGGFGRCFEPPRAGTTSSRGTLGPVIHSIRPSPTYGGVGPASGGLQGARRLAYDPGITE